MKYLSHTFSLEDLNYTYKAVCLPCYDYYNNGALL